jgi:hypothetical protein
MLSPVAKRELLAQHFCKIEPQTFEKFRLQRHCKWSMSVELMEEISRAELHI